MDADPSFWLWFSILLTIVTLASLGLALGLAPWKRRPGAPETKEAKYQEARRIADQQSLEPPSRRNTRL